MTDSGKRLTRRDFMKVGSLGLAGMLVPRLDLSALEEEWPQQGRVTARLIWTHEQPSLSATRVKMLWRDLVLPITNATVGEADDGIHRVWYELGSDGFAYSGNIQPVRTLLNQPAVAVREGGVLGEISVPYTDAHEAASETSPVAFRLYYESTHWIKASRQDTATRRQWYQAWDDKWKKHYYAAADHVRLVPDEELTPLSPGIPETEKRILVHLGGQYVTALESGRPVFSARVSTGGIFRAGRYATPTGSFRTYFKRPTRHMASGDVAASGYDLPGVPWVSYINEDGIGFHGTYWHNEFGRPRSHGCINLTPQAAKWLYRWTLPTVHPAQETAYLAGGTRVEILA